MTSTAPVEAEVTQRTARMALAATAKPYDPEVPRLAAQHGPQEALERLMAADSPAGHRMRHLDIDQVLVAADSAGARFVVPGDDEWSVLLDALDAPHLAGPWAPLGLWVRGESLLATNDPVAVVGARASTAYGDNVAREMAADLAAQGRTVVVTPAYGVSTAALRGVLAAGGHTMLVLPCGIDSTYPRASEALVEEATRHGTVVTEFAPFTPPSRASFLAVARLLAGLATASVVVEAAARSNACWTATWTESLGRPLLAVPGPVSSALSQLPNQLIRDGRARLVASAHHIAIDTTTTEE